MYPLQPIKSKKNPIHKKDHQQLKTPKFKEYLEIFI